MMETLNDRVINHYGGFVVISLCLNLHVSQNQNNVPKFPVVEVHWTVGPSDVPPDLLYDHLLMP